MKPLKRYSRKQAACIILATAFCLTTIAPFCYSAARTSISVERKPVQRATVSKFSDALTDRVNNSRSGDDRLKLIVELKGQASAKLTELMRRPDVKPGRLFKGLGAEAVEMPARYVQELGALSEVSYATLDANVSSLGDYGSGSGPGSGHVVTTTGAAAAEAEYGQGFFNLNGSGVGVAVIDSGVDRNHRALGSDSNAARSMVSRDFTGENRTDDPFGHGTFVVSQIAGSNTLYNGKYAGLASGVRIINLRVLDSQGMGTTSNVLAALSWVMTYHSAYNIRVVNLSVGTAAIDSYADSPLCQAVRKLVNAGIVVVVAAGNSGKDDAGNKLYGAIHCPGNEPSALTVGASNTFGTNARNDDGVTSFSSRGPTRSFYTDGAGVRHYDDLLKPDIIAPGNKIIGAEAANSYLIQSDPSLDAGVSSSGDSRMMYLSGTSVSTAIVSGAVALMLQASPWLTPNLVKMALEYTAQPLAGFNTLEQGAGQLNLEGGVRLGTAIVPWVGLLNTLGSPMLLPFNNLSPVTTIAGYRFPWAQGVIMGQVFGTGSNLITRYQKIYATGVLLGDGVALSDGVALADGTLLSSGVALSDAILTSDGTQLGDGTNFLPAGVLLGDGVALSDGVLLGDGLLTSDSMLLSEGTLLTDSLQPQIIFDGDNTAYME